MRLYWFNLRISHQGLEFLKWEPLFFIAYFYCIFLADLESFSKHYYKTPFG